MKEELQDSLYKKYPKLFRQKDMSMQVTCMCWGVCCQDGWYWLIDMLCGCIQSYVDNNKKTQPEFGQVKQKYGSLRVYCDNSDTTIEGMIWFAEYMSYKICEKCGSTKDITHTKGYIRTLCKNCVTKH